MDEKYYETQVEIAGTNSYVYTKDGKQWLAYIYYFDDGKWFKEKHYFIKAFDTEIGIPYYLPISQIKAIAPYHGDQPRLVQHALKRVSKYMEKYSNDWQRQKAIQRAENN